jgi:nucleotide-binding universal stress UspA family protein
MTQQETSLWAIDPFADKRSQLKVAQHLKEFLRESSNKIEPTAVLNPSQLRLPQDTKELKSQFKTAAQKSLAKISQSIKIPNLVAPAFVFSEEYSQRKAVETFLAYAQEKRAELIAVGTHARIGVERWLLGSFAESLVLQSNIPLLIVNPKVHLPKKIKTILFPTDLSEASEKGLKKLIPTARRLKAKIILFHKMDYVIPETYPIIYRSDLYEKYLKDDEAKRHGQLERWTQMLEAQGIDSDIVIDEKPSFIPKAIVKAAKKHKAQLIAIVSHTGSVSAALLGSITRQVVRSADCPIWSWHTMEK